VFMLLKLRLFSIRVFELEHWNVKIDKNTRLTNKTERILRGRRKLSVCKAK